MKKWMLMLCFLLFFDVQMIGGMRDKTSLSTFRQAGMPVELFQKMGMKAQDMEQYLGFWEDLKYFPVAGRKEAPKEVFYFEDTWLEDGIMEESGLIKGVTFLEKRTDENIIRW